MFRYLLQRNPYCHFMLASMLLLCTVEALPTLAWARISAQELGHAAVRLVTRDGNTGSRATASLASSLFQEQFRNPSQIMSVLLLIGGDVIQKAIAQVTKKSPFTPVVFSFGWVSYAFIAVSSAVGDGTYLPRPEYPAKVLNIRSGDMRDNDSWVIGRLIRDLEIDVENKIKMVNNKHLETSLLITIFQAVPEQKSHKPLNPAADLVWWSFVPFLLIQLALAVLPIALRKDDRNWSIMLITCIGNMLALFTSSLPCIQAEKYKCRGNSRSVYALTRGNGHKHVFILLPDTLTMFREEDRNYQTPKSSLPFFDDLAASTFRASQPWRMVSIILAILWVVLLIAVGGLKQDTWYLFGVGAVGMIHNIIVAGMPRQPGAHGFPLKQSAGELETQFGRTVDIRRKLQSILLEVEEVYPGVGLALRRLFFTGPETRQDIDRWSRETVSTDTLDERLARWEISLFNGRRSDRHRTMTNSERLRTAQPTALNDLVENQHQGDQQPPPRNSLITNPGHTSYREPINLGAGHRANSPSEETQIEMQRLNVASPGT